MIIEPQKYLKLLEENTKLKKFFFEAMDIAWDGGDWDGCNIQDSAEECGLGYFDDNSEDQFIVTLDK
jgi:hypothetical protein